MSEYLNETPDYEILRTMSVGLLYETMTGKFYMQLIFDNEEVNLNRQDHFIQISEVQCRHISETSKLDIEIRPSIDHLH